MVIFEDGRIAGTIGGGKFESLVIEQAQKAMATGKAVLKTYPLHEASEESFGAICGGEVTVFIEPQARAPLFCLVGAGHCAQALAKLASECGFAVTVLDDRADLLGLPHFDSSIRCLSEPTQKHLSAPTNGLNAMHSFSSVAITISTGKLLPQLLRREAWGILE
jgi:hypothetical protein